MIARDIATRVMEGIVELLRTDDDLLIVTNPNGLADAATSRIYLGPFFSQEATHIAPPQINVLAARRELAPGVGGHSTIDVPAVVALFWPFDRHSQVLGLSGDKIPLAVAEHIAKRLWLGSDGRNRGGLHDPDAPPGAEGHALYINDALDPLEIAAGREVRPKSIVGYPILANYKTKINNQFNRAA